MQPIETVPSAASLYVRHVTELLLLLLQHNRVILRTNSSLQLWSTVRIAYNAAEKSRGNPRIISTTSYQVQFIMRKSILSSDSATS